MNRTEVKDQAIAFIRVWEDSFGERTEEFQRAAIFVYCEKYRVEVVAESGEVVGSDGVSEITPAFEYLIKRAEKGDIKKIILSDCKVLGCDPVDVNRRLKMLRDTGAEIISVMDAVNADPSDEMMLKLIVYLTKAMVEKDEEHTNVVENYIINYYGNYPYGNAINGGEAV